MIRLRLLLVAAMLPACAIVPAAGQPARFLASPGPVGDYTVPVRSVQARKFTGVIRQRYDFSCGSAALATLLRHHYDFGVDEAAVFRGMWASGDRAQIRRLGFSLLDMKRWLSSRGLPADGYKVSLDQIEKTGIPGIALIAVRDYRHFVVVKGVRGQDVLLGDPSRGVLVMRRAAFEKHWNGIYFALADAQVEARRSFNRGDQWLAFPRAPAGNGFSAPVSQQALSITAPFYGDTG
ncbi:C39 family peptidase [Sphingomonas sp. ac-8]|uniref:C39 family peptidase n=1 Tax=Sphingomonas sp. ac-8 TaxID=3242977 RepID=UPI003A7FC4C1